MKSDIGTASGKIWEALSGKGEVEISRIPKLIGAKTLVALTMSAFMGSKRVVLQLYTDRIQAGRCEIDAVSVLPD